MFNKIWKNKEDESSFSLVYTKEDILQHPIPKHVAIIMDGNGRWAKKRALPRAAGHYEGMQVVRKITRFANELGIKILSLYAFSTENWKRPKSEVEYLMKLPEQFLTTFLPELIEENVNVRVIGNTEQLPEHTRRAVEKAIYETKDNTGLILNFALNYGSRAEITYAVQQIAKEIQNGRLSPEQITEELVSSYLMTKDLTDPDLLIRTSGEIRLSNFMLWQLAYTEFWFTDVLWPDFTEQHLLEAIAAFQKRNRRFGGV
ncbi:MULTISPECIES: isoprenyl transferase [Parageobacillus]|jgi:undecaprenyl diphosphate synthase|uniref:Isoprenyl transferase n=1 Tax=Parageobacillus thermoglucosidasius TaxID=1426 RepID=A0A1B7KTD8_PARTM|nr:MULTISPECIES: isoprenyl transferase [Parageobacillus]OAT73340.1 isoprenyl transferase [Parageobacillus thermoglucosidasius]BDG48019.1 isoprenyl transferase [Parageobacillus sp. KH3-4]